MLDMVRVVCKVNVFSLLIWKLWSWNGEYEFSVNFIGLLCDFIDCPGKTWCLVPCCGQLWGCSDLVGGLLVCANVFTSSE
jgi:hypothetical protein